MDSRYKINKKILKKIKKLVDMFPDQRFGQILVNYVFPNMYDKDIFFDESFETLKTLNSLNLSQDRKNNHENE